MTCSVAQPLVLGLALLLCEAGAGGRSSRSSLLVCLLRKDLQESRLAGKLSCRSLAEEGPKDIFCVP